MEDKQDELLLTELTAIMKEKEDDLAGQETDVWLEQKLERILAKAKPIIEKQERQRITDMIETDSALHRGFHDYDGKHRSKYCPICLLVASLEKGGQ